MTRISWDSTNRPYEDGVDRGVFYPPNVPGVAWNGLTSIIESPSEGDEQTRYIDGVKTYIRRRSGNFEGTIQALTCPKEFYESVLTQRRQRRFGLSYRVQTEDSYKIHLVYNILTAPSELVYNQNDATPFSWSFTTDPIAIPYASPTAHLIVDAARAYSWTVDDLEKVLYGDDERAPSLPSPAEVLDIFEVNSILRIIDHGDGTWTAIGVDEVVQMLDATTFQIDWPSAVYLDDVTYKISSL